MKFLPIIPELCKINYSYLTIIPWYQVKFNSSISVSITVKSSDTIKYCHTNRCLLEKNYKQFNIIYHIAPNNTNTCAFMQLKRMANVIMFNLHCVEVLKFMTNQIYSVFSLPLHLLIRFPVHYLFSHILVIYHHSLHWLMLHREGFEILGHCHWHHQLSLALDMCTER